VSEGIKTPLPGAGIFQFTAGQATGSEWFGPGLPPAASAQAGAEGRAFDFQAGINLQQRPRALEGVTFDQLRGLAEGYDLLRLVIETRKDQIEKLHWDIRKRGEKPRKGAPVDPTAKRIREFLQCPDREHTFGQWLRTLLDDLFVIDAPTVYCRRTLGGDPYSLDIIDGATIKRVLDATGRTPQEGPAYQQILHGVTAANYERTELLYMPRNLRSYRVYGYSPVEQVMTTVNIALRRQLHQLSFYTEGSTPNLIFSAPKEWSVEQIKAYQAWWDSLKNRKGARFVPEGVKPIDTKEGALKDSLDEWLARIICYAFSVSPQALVAIMNRATAETAHQMALEEGLAPVQNWVKAALDWILTTWLNAADYEFVWSDEKAVDPKVRAEIDEIDTRSGVRTVDECREDRGLDPIQNTEEGTGPGVSGGGEAVQDTALNGAQVSSLLQIVQAAAAAGLPKASAKAMIRAAFPAITDQIVNAIVDPIQPEKPEPVLPAQSSPALPGQGGDSEGKGKPGKAGEAPASPAVSKACPCGHAHDPLAKATKKLKPIKRNRPTLKKLEAKIHKTTAAFLAVQVRPLAEAIFAEVGKAQASGDLQKMGRDEALQILKAVGMDWSGLGEDLEPLLSAIAQDGGSAALAQLGKTTEELLEQVNEKAVAWAEKHAAELVTKISDVTREKIAGDVAAALELGMSVDELADALSSAYAFSDQRAELIATTERAFADVRGNTLAYAESGVVAGLEWVTANGGDDGRTCEECEMNNGAVVPMDADGNAAEPFPSGAMTVPAHPGCLCDLLPALKEEE